MTRATLAVILTTAGMAVSAAVAAPAATAQTRLGNVQLPDVMNWCNRQGHTGEPRPLDVNNAYTWRCTEPRGSNAVADVNMNAVCDLKFGSLAYSKAENPHNAYSWYCWR